VLDEHTVVQPDLCWVSLARRYRVGDRIQGAPDLMVEILSPASERRDRVWKLTLYARSDVREVWLADPDSRSFEAFENRSGDLFPLRPDPNRYASSVLPHLVLDLDELWADSERWDPKAD
jgi:Uma2 family endonuclease